MSFRKVIFNVVQGILEPNDTSVISLLPFGIFSVLNDIISSAFSMHCKPLTDRIPGPHSKKYGSSVKSADHTSVERKYDIPQYGL